MLTFIDRPELVGTDASLRKELRLNTQLSGARTAVVVGGSIGGSTAALALRPHFDRVIIIDRDELPDGPKDRKGAPHAYQFHGLTFGGLQAMESLLPGLTESATAAGCPSHDPGRMQYGSKFGFFAQCDTDMTVLAGSRLKLEAMLRAATRDLDRIEVLERQTATGLRVENGIVTGVNLVDAAGTVSTIDADLVVDSSGRSSAAGDWLEDAGYQRPEETVINARWSYVTTYIRPNTDYKPPFPAFYASPTIYGEGAAASRGGGTWWQEDGLWVLTAQGVGEHPPTDAAGFREYLGSFGRSEFTDLLDNSEIVKPLVPWRNTTSRLRDYANLPIRPENFVVIGDAVAAFNPVYGQGMSSAALQAKTLSDELQNWSGSDLIGFAERFQKTTDVQIIQSCWGFSAGSDLTIPGVEVNGETHEVVGSAEQDYVDRVLALATEDPAVAHKMWEMIQITRGPEWMSEPDLRATITANWDRLGKKRRDDNLEAVGA
ncbi:FAD-dependent oxidoreductase [Rhodococcoides fascians]|uniref:FAD-dependent oxidoreductase n=1 Tax=Rhodococcoides fascians TaxID=1828 RepID=UPI0026AE3CB1